MMNQSVPRQHDRGFGRILLSAMIFLCSLAHAHSDDVMHDPGFESLAAGALSPTGRVKSGWEIQSTGREGIKDRLHLRVINNADQSHTGNQCVELTIPAETKGFEFVTVGQRLSLQANTEYVASVWVRWADEMTTPESNAIVSFWIRDRDGQGHFAGRDVWLTDHRWTELEFRYRPNDVSEGYLLYVSLLPNQKPVATTLLVDDFTIRPAFDNSDATADARRGNLIVYPRFETSTKDSLDPPWYFRSVGGQTTRGELIEDADDHCFSIKIPSGTGNFESAQLWQHVHLVEGNRYRISATIRWDNYSPSAKPPIVNHGVYRQETNTWYGPVDLILKPSGKFETYGFDHIATASGDWKVYAQLNGWGNFGRPVSISIQEITCEVLPY